MKRLSENAESTESPWNTSILLTQFITLVGFAFVLVVLGTLSEPHELQNPVSVSALEGYPNAIAFNMTVLIALVVGAIVFFNSRNGTIEFQYQKIPFAKPRLAAIDLLVILAVTVSVVLFFYPGALARNGPFIEESVHLSAIHRMLNGQVPYEDFLFLYGPLMLYVPYFWCVVFGFSLTSLYCYIVVFEILVLWITFALIHRNSASYWWRFVIFLVFGSMLINFALGPNQSGLRRIAGVAILLLIVQRPFSRQMWILTGVALGTLLCYSHEFGVATAVAITTVFGLIFAKTRSLEAVTALVTIGAVSALVWLGIAWALLGENTLTYFETIRGLAEYYDNGEAAFPVALNVNTVAVLALLFVGIWQSGMMMAMPWKRDFLTGDLVIVGATAYALIMLKSGLTRSDVWHLDPAVYGLALAFSLKFPTANMPVAPIARYAAVGLTLLISLSMAVGNLGHANYIKGSVKLGYQDIFSGLPSFGDTHAGAVYAGTVLENTSPSSEFLKLRKALVETGDGVQIFPYGDLHTALNFRIDVPMLSPFGDDFIYDDGFGEMAVQLLVDNPDLLVVIDRTEFLWLLKGPEVAAPLAKQWTSDRRRSFLINFSSSHFRAGPIESQIKQERWRRLVGNFVVQNYEQIYDSDRFVVLKAADGRRN